MDASEVKQMHLSVLNLGVCVGTNWLVLSLQICVSSQGCGICKLPVTSL